MSWQQNLVVVFSSDQFLTIPDTTLTRKIKKSDDGDIGSTGTGIDDSLGEVNTNTNSKRRGQQ